MRKNISMKNFKEDFKKQAAESHKELTKKMIKKMISEILVTLDINNADTQQHHEEIQQETHVINQKMLLKNHNVNSML